MNEDIFNLNNKIYSNNNNILLGIINDLQQIMNNMNDNIIIKRISDIIIKLNIIINENKKNIELIRNDIQLMINKFDELKFNNNINNNKELKYKDGKYIGQVINDKAEGKGIWYGYNGDRYEGEWRNGNKEGKGIYYYAKSGDRYDGEWRNNIKEGKGIAYFANGDRRMGDYLNGKEIGMHVRLTRNWEVKIENY